MKKFLNFKKVFLLALGFILLLVLPFSVFRESNSPPRQMPLNDTIQPYAVPEDEAAALVQKASENYFYREFKQGADNYRKAIAIYESRKDYPSMARIYHSLGDLYLWARKLDEAEENYVQAASYHMQTQDAQGQANDLMEIGEIYRKTDRFDTAEEWYQKSLKALHASKINRVLGRVQEARGHNYWANEQLPQAIDAFTQAHNTYSQLNYQMGAEHISHVLDRLKVNSARLHRHALRDGEDPDGFQHN